MVTDETNFLLVHARAEGETPTEMPDLHKVAQMVPAGWGGMGSVAGPDSRFCEACYEPPPPLPDTGDVESRPAFYRRAQSAAPNADMDADQDYLDIPAFLRRVDDSSRSWTSDSPPPSDERPGRSPLALSNWLRNTPHDQWPRTYRELQAISLGVEVLDWLELVMAVSDAERWEEETVVTTFLHCIASDEFHALLARPGRITDAFRAIVQRLRGARAGQPEMPAGHQVDPNLAARMLTALHGITPDRWPDSVCGLTT